jgi:hypothetical protein
MARQTLFALSLQHLISERKGEGAAGTCEVEMEVKGAWASKTAALVAVGKGSEGMASFPWGWGRGRVK